MAAAILWLQEQWFNLVQSLGILGGLWLTRAAFTSEVESRKVGDYLTLAGHHRELWMNVHDRHELTRIFLPEVDLVGAPISVAEEEFLNLVIVHFSTGWLMTQHGGLVKLPSLTADIRALFSLPVPRCVWDKTAHFRDPRFVKFVESCISKRR